MQEGSSVTPSGPNPGSGSPGGTPSRERHTRYNTLTKRPPKLGSVQSYLLRSVGRTGFANKNEVIAAIRSVDRVKYADAAGLELFRFLEAYGVLYQRNGRWWVEVLRFQEVIIACDNKKSLQYGFVTPTVPGTACGCPQGSTPPANGGGAGKSAAQGSTPPANGGGAGKIGPEKQPVIRRMAYMTHLERHALSVIDIVSAHARVGEFRSPTHMDDEAFRKSEFGQLFDWPRELFVAMLERFVAAGIIAVRSATGPEGAFDTLVFQIPFAEIQIVEIIERRPQAIPGIVLDLIVRTLNLEGLTSFKDGLTATVRRAMVNRLSRRGIRYGEKVVGVFANHLFHYNEAAPENGWGLVLPGAEGVDAVICLPGFAPVQFVEDSTMMRRLARDVIASAEAEPQTTERPAPSRITAADVQTMDDATLATALAETETLLEVLKAEAPRREEVRRKAELRAQLETRLAEARAAETLQAEAAERARQQAEAARREAERAADETRKAAEARAALEAELAQS